MTQSVLGWSTSAIISPLAGGGDREGVLRIVSRQNQSFLNYDIQFFIIKTSNKTNQLKDSLALFYSETAQFGVLYNVILSDIFQTENNLE